MLDIAFTGHKVGNLALVNIKPQYGKSDFVEAQHQRQTDITKADNGNQRLFIFKFGKNRIQNTHDKNVSLLHTRRLWRGILMDCPPIIKPQTLDNKECPQAIKNKEKICAQVGLDCALPYKRPFY